jgi:hypothetical protein
MMGAEDLEARLTAFIRATQVVGSSLDLHQALEAIVQQAAAISDGGGGGRYLAPALVR